MDCCAETYRGGGDFAGGIFRCGKFRISNVCEISRSIFRPLCEINPVRNLATGDSPDSREGCFFPPPPFPELLGFTRCSTRLSLFLPSMYPKALRIVDELKKAPCPGCGASKTGQ